MKKFTTVLLALVMVVSIISCGNSAEEAGLTGSEEITMENIDQYLDEDARFIDLRDFSDMFSGGYIEGFEVVPFFQYLEGRALVRNNGWEFSEADVADAAMLENVFGSKEDVVVLMCGSGTRAGYTKDALESIGYTKVINAGGIRDYQGDYKVLGDGSYAGLEALPAEVTMENIDQYLHRDGAKYVDLRNVADKYTGGYIDGFEVVSFFEYLEGNALVRNNGWEFSEEDIVDPAILENIFGAKEREVFVMCGSGTRSGYTKEALEALGYENVYNVGGIRDYSGDNKIFGDESFTLALQ
jgi:rhodanese-related sulfurtransferase